MAVNYASQYAKAVDERFYQVSQAAMALNNRYTFTGVKTVNVYSIPTVALNNYTRSGSNRYGTPSELENSVQELTVTQDKSFTFTIDRANRAQTMMQMDAGAALEREIREVVVPAYDTYVFKKLAEAAIANGQTASTTVTKANAYEQFLAAQEALGDASVPDSGRVCFCSYKFANFLKQDPAFMIASEKARSQVEKGYIGTVDGVKVVQVPKSHLPTKTASGSTVYCCDFILTHPVAAAAPKQLEDYKIHDNPPGISGWLVEGRMLFDCFVLNSKKSAIYYHGAALT